MTLYKLTDGDGYTRRGLPGETLWVPGEWHEAPGGELGSANVLYAYEDPRIAAVMNPIHAAISDPQLWEAEGDVCVHEGQLKCGCTRLRVTRKIELPVLTTEQRVEIAIRCALVVCTRRAWRAWANKWLSGEDRTGDAARLAEVGALGAPAVWAAAAAADAADNDPACAACAAWAVRSAVKVSPDLDVIAIIERAVGGGSRSASRS